MSKEDDNRISDLWRSRVEERQRQASELEEETLRRLVEVGFPPDSIRREYRARSRLFDFAIVDPASGTLLALIETRVIERIAVMSPFVFQNLLLIAETLAVPLFMVVRRDGETVLMEPRESGMPSKWPTKPFPQSLPRFSELRDNKLVVVAAERKSKRERTYDSLVLLSFVVAGVTILLLVADVTRGVQTGTAYLQTYHWFVVAGIYMALALPFYNRVRVGSSLTLERKVAEDSGDD